MTEIFENNQLQFAQVLTQVASYAKSPEARNLLLQAQPLTKPAAVTHLLDETEEGTRLLEAELAAAVCFFRFPFAIDQSRSEGAPSISR
ncbi:hypothetical protein AT236_00106 [Lactobacillus delbrueckii subsp. bulgaricus]|nr:hypothetical protein AT236_00106 [Lactobacillus delbrueckii subsp. bulgaricus]